jgi:hypothetical protein
MSNLLKACPRWQLNHNASASIQVQRRKEEQSWCNKAGATAL